MHVEDLLVRINSELIIGGREFRNSLDQWSAGFISDVAGHVGRGSALSFKQAKIVLDKIELLRETLISRNVVGAAELDDILANPSYRLPLHESQGVPREVRHMGDHFLGFRGGNKEIGSLIKLLGRASLTPWLLGGTENPLEYEKVSVVDLRARFDWYYKIWIVPVYRFNLQAITDLIATHKFKPDQATADYLRGARKSLDKASAATVSGDGDVLLFHVPDDPLLASWLTEMAGGIAV